MVLATGAPDDPGRRPSLSDLDPPVLDRHAEDAPVRAGVTREGPAHRFGPVRRREQDDAAPAPRAAGLAGPRARPDGGLDRGLDRRSGDDGREEPPRLPTPRREPDPSPRNRRRPSPRPSGTRPNGRLRGGRTLWRPLRASHERSPSCSCRKNAPRRCRRASGGAPTLPDRPPRARSACRPLRTRAGGARLRAAGSSPARRPACRGPASRRPARNRRPRRPRGAASRAGRARRRARPSARRSRRARSPRGPPRSSSISRGGAAPSGFEERAHEGRRRIGEQLRRAARPPLEPALGGPDENSPSRGADAAGGAPVDRDVDGDRARVQDVQGPEVEGPAGEVDARGGGSLDGASHPRKAIRRRIPDSGRSGIPGP